MNIIRFLAIAGMVAAGDPTPPIPHVQLGASVQVIYSSGLHDAAYTKIEGGRPVIHVNPEILRALGEDMTQFVLLHEQGHIVRGHVTRLRYLTSDDESLEARRGMELEADCFAAFQLAALHPEALSAVVQYFKRAGSTRGSVAHPTGAERSARILQCSEASRR